MKLRLLISLSLPLMAWQRAGAQLAPAEDFFNSGAQLYISNNIPAALTRTETGLKLYPDDQKLQQLEKLLKQKQQQNQQNQQQNQQNQSQQQKDQQKQQQQQNQQQQSGQKDQSGQKKDDRQNQQQGKKPEDQNKNGDQQQLQPAEKNGDKKDGQDAQARQAQAGQMSPADARRLLDQQKGNEQILRMVPSGKPQDDTHPVKDW